MWANGHVSVLIAMTVISYLVLYVWLGSSLFSGSEHCPSSAQALVSYDWQCECKHVNLPSATSCVVCGKQKKEG